MVGEGWSLWAGPPSLFHPGAPVDLVLGVWVVLVSVAPVGGIGVREVCCGLVWSVQYWWFWVVGRVVVMVWEILDRETGRVRKWFSVDSTMGRHVSSGAVRLPASMVAFNTVTGEVIW